MKTLIFIAPLSRGEEIAKLKEDLISYFGTRSIYTENGNDPYAGYPALGIVEEIKDSDVSVICSMIGGSDISVLVTESSEIFLTKSYYTELSLSK